MELKDIKCALCNNTPIFKNTNHLFLDLAKLKPKLEKWINKASKDGNWSNNALQSTRGWLEQGLLKRCITRDLKWGIPVPLKGYEDKVFYVWFDACIGYISITATLLENWQDWWKNPEDVELFQFMGKDNIPFHTVVFPSTQIGTEEKWTMLKTISSTEYLNYEDIKFSKSRGTGVFGDEAKETGIEADLFRYYLLRIRPEKNDTQFFWNDFMEKCNGEIIANYANLVNRTTQFIIKFFEGKVPHFEIKEDSFLKKMPLETYKNEIIDLFEQLEIKKALMRTLEICSEGNKYFQDLQPWALVKTNKDKAEDVIGNLCGFIKDISILLWPYIPGTVEKVFHIFNLTKEDINLLNIGNYEKLKAVKINNPEILFNKLDPKVIEKLREKFSGKQEVQVTPEELFSKLCLKVGKIIEISKHPEADKLYIEKVDMGNGEIRQIVSGLVPYYKEEELLNKKIVLAYNLKPAVLRGIESKGMLLAAETKKKEIVEVISPDCEIGEIVTIDGSKPNSEEITIDKFLSVPMTVNNFTIEFMGKPLKTASNILKVFKVETGRVG